jgi:hypothetical protein
MLFAAFNDGSLLISVIYKLSLPPGSAQDWQNHNSQNITCKQQIFNE